MSTFKRKYLASLIAASVMMGGAHASPGGVGGATEVTQWLNNVELFGINVQSVLAVEKQVEQYIQQVKQFERQVKDAAKFGGVLQSVDNIAGQIRAANGYLQKLQKVKSDFTSLEKIVTLRKLESSLKGMTLQNYLRREATLIAENDARAKQRLETERDILNQTTADMSAAQEYSRQIGTLSGGNEGLNQSIGLLNTQMNLMITQNARMAQIMANATGTQQMRSIDQENDLRVQANATTVDYTNAYKRSIERQERMLDSSVNMTITPVK